MGSIILNARDPASAIPYFQTYIAARPRDPRGHFALGVAYFAAADYDELPQGNGKREPGSENRNRSGVLSWPRRTHQRELRPGRVVLLERAIRQSPAFAEAYSELARVRLHQGRTNDAKAAIERALSLSPDSFQANSTLLAFYQRTHDPRAEKQAVRLKTLDEERGRAMELMLRSVEVKPY